MTAAAVRTVSGRVDEGVSATVPVALEGSSVLFYDGVCGLCNGFVRFLLRRKRPGICYFAPLQSPLAKETLNRHGHDATALETMVLVERFASEGESASTRSEAVFRVLRRLGGPWRVVAWLDGLPRPLLDFGYRLTARVRYTIFGRYDHCPLPTPNDRHRFVDGEPIPTRPGD